MTLGRGSAGGTAVKGHFFFVRFWKAFSEKSGFPKAHNGETAAEKPKLIKLQ